MTEVTVPRRSQGGLASARLTLHSFPGKSTRKAETLLAPEDLDRIYHLEGSLEQWLKQGHPVEKGGPPPTGWH